MEYFIAPDARRTDDFLLRSDMPGDGEKLSKSVTESYRHLKLFMPWAKIKQSREESEELARQFRGRWLLAQDFIIGIWSPDESELWGGCGYHLREGGLETRNAEVGMWINELQSRRGLGTAVLRELIDWGFSEWPWVRLSWRCDPKNEGSIRVAEKVGLTGE